MLRATTATNRNVRLAKQRWAGLSRVALLALRELSREYGLSVALGDLLYFDERWYISHAGLLRIARKKKCSGIIVECVGEFSDPGATRWAFKATVFKPGDCKGFVGFGDADPSNIAAGVRGAEMRVAETRAVNRALRKAYGIGLCSVVKSEPFQIQQRSCLRRARMAMATVLAPRSATASARPSASTSSTLN